MHPSYYRSAGTSQPQQFVDSGFHITDYSKLMYSCIAVLFNGITSKGKVILVDWNGNEN